MVSKSVSEDPRIDNCRISRTSSTSSCDGLVQPRGEARRAGSTSWTSEYCVATEYPAHPDEIIGTLSEVLYSVIESQQ